jgi:TRAP transporter TAXI family solute receptor
MSLSELLLFSRRDLVRTGLLVALLAAACIWVSFRFLDPIPPRKLVLASGPESGLYHQLAQRYKEVLVGQGVTLEERITEGAGENYRLLLDHNSGVDIAFVQGGIAKFPEANSLVMIASLYYEPLWIFVRRGERIDALSMLADKRISMGMPGSGTNALATPLLAASGINSGDAKLLRVPTDRAQHALKGGDVDVAMMVGGVRSPAIRAALTDPALELVNLAQADAYPQRYTFLTRRTLHAGAIEFVPLTPPRDIALISTEAMLVARDDVHPAIVNLLLETIRDEHDDQGYFEAPNEFPNVEQVDLRVAGRHPPPAFRPDPLYRYMPFWVATFLERFIIIVVPLLVVMLPLFKFLPEIMRWRVRSRIYRWYGELTLLERDVRLRDGELPIKRWLSDLERIQRGVERVATPASFASEVYTLREHIDLVRRAVLAKVAAAEAPPSAG